MAWAVSQRKSERRLFGEIRSHPKKAERGATVKIRSSIRTFVLGAVVTCTVVTAASGAAASSARPSAKSASKVVYINSSGGSPDEAFRKYYWDPFTKATGIRVVNTAPVDNAKLAAMVASRNVEWDIAEIDDGDFPSDIKRGLLAKIDWSKLPKSRLLKQAINPYGVWDAIYSTILVWDTDKWPMTRKHPKSLMDLWNQKDFPGLRCLQKSAADNIEWGALHAGVNKKRLYPINQDLAYKQLDLLKKNVAVWWTSGAQSVQAIVNHDCVMGTAWNGRPYALVTQSRAHLGVAWKGAMLHIGWWAIPKGAPNYANALKLLAFMQDARRQAKVAEATGYAGGVAKTPAYLPAKVKNYLASSPAHVKASVVVNDTWWAKNVVDAENRFTKWVIGG